MVRMTIEFAYRCMITAVILIGVSQVAMFAAAFGPHALEEPMVNVMRFFLALGILSGTLALMGGAWGVLRKIGSRLGGPFRSRAISRGPRRGVRSPGPRVRRGQR